ncbi:hypothetical protein GCM10018980_56800 [Streptomyces capoamus]|uniref:Uncharacterized protein n=1 Tax=Streptomyces capoamus TaxID=68183 RepID=A0A919F067_9ACTN|nr:hypothetical protein GCM10010501_56890 [Streptomyces libani subsp. rufus]GHG65221.1 hypothetical protein GCM10018980_56800 [Streptomyces capoamus]
MGGGPGFGGQCGQEGAGGGVRARVGTGVCGQGCLGRGGLSGRGYRGRPTAPHLPGSAGGPGAPAPTVRGRPVGDDARNG